MPRRGVPDLSRVVEALDRLPPLVAQARTQADGIRRDSAAVATTLTQSDTKLDLAGEPSLVVDLGLRTALAIQQKGFSKTHELQIEAAYEGLPKLVASGALPSTVALPDGTTLQIRVETGATATLWTVSPRLSPLIEISLPIKATLSGPFTPTIRFSFKIIVRLACLFAAQRGISSCCLGVFQVEIPNVLGVPVPLLARIRGAVVDAIAAMPLFSIPPLTVPGLRVTPASILFSPHLTFRYVPEDRYVAGPPIPIASPLPAGTQVLITVAMSYLTALISAAAKAEVPPEIDLLVVSSVVVKDPSSYAIGLKALAWYGESCLGLADATAKITVLVPTVLATAIDRASQKLSFRLTKGAGEVSIDKDLTCTALGQSVDCPDSARDVLRDKLEAQRPNILAKANGLDVSITAPLPHPDLTTIECRPDSLVIH